jgi:HPt (histidine-containing phosphotransfer) domain-containing protein
MAEPAIDLATFEELKQTAGAEFVGELADTFLAEAPSMLEDLRRALATHNTDQFRRTAHSLKSNSNTFGARELGAMARDLELTGLDQVLKGHARPLDALALEYARVEKALRELKRA